MGLRDIDSTPPYMIDEYTEVLSPRSGNNGTEDTSSSVLDELRENPLHSSLWIVYGGTAVITFVMILIDSIMHSTGFFSFLWQTIKGVFSGIFGGILWPFLVLLDIGDMWAILFPFVGMLLFVYKLFFDETEYQRYYLITVVVYILLSFAMSVHYFTKI